MYCMRRLKVVSFLVVLMISAAPFVSIAQNYIDRNEAAMQRDFLFGGALFSYDAFVFSAEREEQIRLEVHATFVNDILQFARVTEDVYEAIYEISIMIKDKKDNYVRDEEIKGSITTKSFEETNSRQNSVIEKFIFLLEPDEYNLTIKLTDLDTRKSLIRERKIERRDFRRDKIHLSDILFADSLEFDQHGVTKMKPNILRTFDDPTSQFRAYYEIYAPEGADSVEVSHNVTNAYGETVYDHTEIVAAVGKQIKHVIPLGELIEAPGIYELQVRTVSNGHQATMRSRFFIQWSNFTFVDSNLDLAIEQLKYVANRKDINAMLDATENERQMLFDEFWRQRDPTPDTERNELREEFFNRVNFSNKNFTILSSNRDGWQTDRGRMYIIYGPPTDIERETAQVNMAAYEIWYYRHLNRRFIFADRSGIGDYQLMRVE